MRRAVIFIIFFIFCFNILGQTNPSIAFSDLKKLQKDQLYSAIIQKEITPNDFKNDFERASAYLIMGEAYEIDNQDDKAYEYFKLSLGIFEELQDFENSANLNRLIYNLLESQKNLEIDKQIYLDNFYKYAQNSKSPKWLASYYTSKGVQFLNNNTGDSAKYYFNKAYKLAIDIDSLKLQTHLAINLGSTYSLIFQDQDSAIQYYELAIKTLHSDSLLSQDTNLSFNIYNNAGNAYRRKKDYKKALEYYDLAEHLDLSKFENKSKNILYANIEATYFYLNDWYNAYDYLYKRDSIQEIILLEEQNKAIVDVKEKYDNEKLRADNLVIEAKRLRNKNFLIASLVLLGFSGITLLLYRKNALKKQKLIEQEKAIESQKLANILKEQELVAIDAMISGQEKERQRIADELHDDLGALMTAVKMHFSAIKSNHTADLVDKTAELIDEASSKVRSIAHAKNTGVIAKDGLLKAVKKMAERLSVNNQIVIEVYDHGLDERLENSLELSIFRIIQELMNNIIKHANASQATIHLTNHVNCLNIMVEDNGKGFNPNQITKYTSGMGLVNIEKRVEHLDGNLTIESQPQNGTTIIIDIPI